MGIAPPVRPKPPEFSGSAVTVADRRAGESNADGEREQCRTLLPEGRQQAAGQRIAEVLDGTRPTKRGADSSVPATLRFESL
jgi:hypothetical protein